MQNPPPPPPPTAGSPSAGIDKRTGAVIIYLLSWIGGLLGLFVFGRSDPDLKYHGAQSLVMFGGLTVVYIAISIVGAFGFLRFVFSILSTIVYILGFILWVVCMYKAWSGGGQRFEVPFIGGVITPYAEQLAAAV